MERCFFRLLSFILIGAIVGLTYSSCEKNLQLPPEEEEPERVKPNPSNDEGEEDENENPEIDYLHEVRFMKAENVDNHGEGINLATGEVYSGEDIIGKFHEIDLIYLDYGNNTRGNLITPDAVDIAINEFGEDVLYGWPLKNRGNLYRLEINDDLLDWFNNIGSSLDLKYGVDSLINSCNLTGENKRVKNLAKDQLLLFKSSDREISAAIYLSFDGSVGEEGSNSRLNIKTDTTNLKSISPATESELLNKDNHYSDTIAVDFNPQDTAVFIVDFRGKQMLSAGDLVNEENIKSSHLLFTYLPSGSGVGTHRLYSMHSSLIKDFSSSLADIINSNKSLLPEVRTLYRANGNSKLSIYQQNTFEDLRNNNKALEVYFNLLGTGDNGHAWRNNPAEGTVFTVQDLSEKIYGAFKLIRVDKLNGKLKIGVKYPNAKE